MSNIRLLFDNGNYYTVNASIHKANPHNSRPADAYIVTENQGDFTIAAKNAVHAAYNSLCQNSTDGLSPNTAGIALTERTDASANIVGESGGLAFAIAYAKALLSLTITDVAATGVVMADGTIKEIKGIETKLKTAADLLCHNGFVFYPAANQFVPDHTLETAFKVKDIQCHPVTHIDQVFDILLTSHSSSTIQSEKQGQPEKNSQLEKQVSGKDRLPGEKNRRFKKRVVVLLALMLAAVIGYIVFENQKKIQDINPPETVLPMEQPSDIQPDVQKTIPLKNPDPETSNSVNPTGFD